MVEREEGSLFCGVPHHACRRRVRDSLDMIRPWSKVVENTVELQEEPVHQVKEKKTDIRLDARSQQ